MRRTPDGAKTIVFPDTAALTMDVRAGPEKASRAGALEYDVTEARALFRRYANRPGKALPYGVADHVSPSP